MVVGKPHPNAPCVIHTTGRYGVLCACSDHGGLSDWYMCIFLHILEEFLFANVNGESSSGVNWFIGFVNVGIDLGLGDCCVVAHEVVIDVADGDPVYPFVGVIQVK